MQLQILGGLHLTSASGEPAPDVTRQTRHMLACLALAGPKGLTRAELCALFWPDRPSALARNSLRQALVAIKKALSGGANAMSLQSDREIVRLSAGAAPIDVHAFRDGLQGNRDGLVAAAYLAPRLGEHFVVSSSGINAARSKVKTVEKYTKD